MPKGRRNAPARRATRRAATGEAAGPGGLPDLVLDPQLGLPDVIAEIASEMVRAVGAARTPLDAELALSPVLGMLDRLTPDEATPEQRTAARHDLLVGLIGWAEAAAAPAALAFLRVAALLGPPGTRDQAGSAAERLAAAGVQDRPWATALGRPELVQAWWYGDVFGQQESVALQYRYHHREHTLSVLIDHQLGGGVKDCWVAEGSRTRNQRDRTAAQMADNPTARFEDVDATRAAQILLTALSHPPCPVEDDQIEDVTRCLDILRCRAAALAGSPT